MKAHLIPCSVQVLTRNSEKSIAHCLETLRSFDEVIVQDAHSQDRTRDIARSFSNVTLMDQNLKFLDEEGRIKDFSAIRNESIRAARNDWILVVDADEGIQLDLESEVRSIVLKGHLGVYIAFRRFFVAGKKIMYASSYPALQIRLFHRSLIVGYEKTVHERIKLRHGVKPEMLKSELPVPLPPAKDLRAKYHRYLMMEVKRARRLTFFGWCRWILFRNIRAIISLIVRLIWIRLMPARGERLPLAYEMQFIAYSFRTIVHTFPLLRWSLDS